MTTQPFRCFCSNECYESAQSDGDEAEETYDWLTVMDGPDVEGCERIWLDRETSPWKQLDEDGGTRVSAEPVQHISLPWPMEREEIKDFLNQDDRGLDYLEQFTLEKAEGEPDI